MTSKAEDMNGTNSLSQNGRQNEKNASANSRARSNPPPAGKGSLVGTLMKLRSMSRRPLPKEMGDGSYRNVVKRPTVISDLKSIGWGDLKTLKDIIKAKLKGETQQDDKTMIMERTIQLVSTMPNFSKRQELLTNDFVDQLWNSLEHPPLLYMGDEYRFRQPDGSNNNPMMPRLGAAGTPYARAVKPRGTGLGALPDPETIFESIMARDTFKKSPNNVSSILWSWATIIIHDLFSTNPRDGNINDSSSYLDLSPLYGSSQEAQNSIRTFKDGMLKPDAFADKRLLGNPPAVCILLIMFNRFHNHVAENLAAINEDNRFVKPTDDMDEATAAAAWKRYDEELFQTARLVTSGLYINITLIDYVRNIVNLNRVHTTWTLDPRQEMGTAVGTKEGSKSGVGNTVSAEFNLCYRWHSCISEKDEEWLHDFFEQLTGKRDHELDIPTLITASKKFLYSLPEDPAECTFGGFRRGANGKYSDHDLIEALTDAIESPGGAFGARNVPRAMKPIELMGIMRGRKWRVAGLNEFRKHFGLKAYETFEDINSDQAVADQLRHLYQHPDYVELYPGLVAEEAKSPMVPGVGITPTYTISRVVLSDAVSLVRGDRHYTTDYHAGSLTNWGYNEVNYDFNINHGCVFYKLFIRAFPDHFQYNSVYAHYPMVTPSENLKILTNLGREKLFCFDKPCFTPPRINVTSYGAAKYILTNQPTYKVCWEEGLGYLMDEGGLRFMLSGDTQLHAHQRECMGKLLYKDDWKKAIKTFYASTAEMLLSEKSYRVAGKTQVDVIRDVGNLAHTHFVARMFNLPLKSTSNPKGIFSEQELYKILAVIFVCIFFDLDPAKSFPLRLGARGVAQQLGSLIETNVKLHLSLGLNGLFTKKIPNDPLQQYGVNMIKGLSKCGLSAYDIAWSQILPTAGAMVPNQAQVFAQTIDWYLSPAADLYRPEVARIAALESSEESDALLLGYAMEGIRMAGTFGLYRKVAAADTINEDDGRAINVQEGDRVFLSFVSAAKDPNVFPEPEKVNPKRPLEAYIHYGVGPHECLGRDISQMALIELFRALFRKPNIRRVPGPQGELKKVPRPGGFYVYLTEDWGSIWPFPTSMKVMWDE